MKNKDYDSKRRKLKDEKREGMKERFESTQHRKKFVEGIKKEFRAVKRSEKQTVQKEIMDKVWGVDDEQYDPKEDEIIGEWQELTPDQIKWMQERDK